MRVEVDPTGAAPGRDRRAQLVIAGGLATTAATLAGVFALAEHDVNIMGWYGYWVIPAGAMIVGVCAALGYGLVAWRVGLRITTGLMVAIVGLLVASYVAAEYVAYTRTHLDVGFFTWFDAVTRAFSFQGSDGGAGDPLGVTGYLFRGLELVGFTCGGALFPVALRKKAYCQPCRTYHRMIPLATVPGGAVAATPTLDKIFSAAEAGNGPAFAAVLAEHGSPAQQRAANRLEERIRVSLTSCPRCGDGRLIATRITGRGRNMRYAVLATKAIDGTRVRAVLGKLSPGSPGRYS